MSCDSYYSIGDKHQVCQDYALHGTEGDMEYVIVADGCSSANYSEVGAQILCHAAKFHINLCSQTGMFEQCSLDTLSSVLGNSILKRINEVRVNYPVDKEALEATLLIAVKVGGKIFVFVWGDGIIIERYKSESGQEFQVVADIDFTCNAPFYLTGDPEQYFKNLKNKGFDKPQTFLNYSYKKNCGSFQTTTKKIDTAAKPYQWFQDLKSTDPSNFFYEEFDGWEALDLVSLSICSDGLKSFQDEKRNPIELTEIVPEVIGYKSTDGDFVKKRMFFLKRKALNNKWSHFDDLSCATIFIN